MFFFLDTLFQEEVSALSPQVTYLDRHRIILNVDNSAMKQRLAALAQEKLFKDGKSFQLITTSFTFLWSSNW